MTTSTAAVPRSVWGYRSARIIQVLGLILGLEALLIFGMEPSEGPMVYTTVFALAVFYAGHWMARRYGPPKNTKRK